MACDEEIVKCYYGVLKKIQNLYSFMYNNANIFLERKYKFCIYNYANTEVTGES